MMINTPIATKKQRRSRGYICLWSFACICIALSRALLDNASLRPSIALIAILFIMQLTWIIRCSWNFRHSFGTTPGDRTTESEPFYVNINTLTVVVPLVCCL